MNYSGCLTVRIKFYRECVIMDAFINKEFIYTHSVGFNDKNSDDSITISYIKEANLSFGENPKDLDEYTDSFGRKYTKIYGSSRIDDMPYWAVENACKALFDYHVNSYLTEIFKNYPELNKHFKRMEEFYRYKENLEYLNRTYPIEYIKLNP